MRVQSSPGTRGSGGGSETSQRPVTAAALPSQTPTTTASSTQPSGGGATTPRQAIRLSDLQNILSTMNGKFSWSKNYMVYSQNERILNFGPSTIVVGNIVLTVTQIFFIRLEEICPCFNMLSLPVLSTFRDLFLSTGSYFDDMCWSDFSINTCFIRMMLGTVAFNCMFYFSVPSGPSKDRKYSLEFVFVLLCRVWRWIIYTNMAVRWVCALVPVNCWHLQLYNQNSYEEFHQHGAISEILVKILM